MASPKSTLVKKWDVRVLFKKKMSEGLLTRTWLTQINASPKHTTTVAAHKTYMGSDLAQPVETSK